MRTFKIGVLIATNPDTGMRYVQVWRVADVITPFHTVYVTRCWWIAKLVQRRVRKHLEALEW